MKSTYVVFSQSGVEDHSSMVVEDGSEVGMVVCATIMNLMFLYVLSIVVITSSAYSMRVICLVE